MFREWVGVPLPDCSQEHERPDLASGRVAFGCYRVFRAMFTPQPLVKSLMTGSG